MSERGASTPRILLALGLVFLMALPMAPAGALENEGVAGPRAVTDESSDLIVPAGETYELYGCRTYTNSVQINGTLKVKPYDGSDVSTGSLWLQAKWILVGASGTIAADGRGYGGGGGASERAGAGGTGGTGGTGGAGDLSRKDGGGGGGSNGGAGGAAGTQGTAGSPGTEAGGGKGGDSRSYVGGPGGTGFGAGGGGGAGFFDPSGTAAGGDGGGGGGGGSGGMIGNGFLTGGDGAGPAKGTGGQAQGQSPGNGNDGGYMVAGTNGDTTAGIGIVKGSGGGGGTSNMGMAIKSGWGGGGGGGAGGGAVAIVAERDITIGGSVTTTGGGGGTGGADLSGSGGTGGGGAGGGVLLWGQKVTVTGSIDARGRTKNSPSTTNGGTVKIFYAVDQFSAGTIQAGRKYTNGRPAMKELLEPQNNSAAPMKPLFKWQSAADPDGDTIKYQLQVSRSYDFLTVEEEHTGIADTQQAASEDMKGGPFYWRVRASDDGGNGSWSETWKFFSDITAPSSGMDPLPKYETAVNFTVSWNGTDDSSGIGGYDIFAAEEGGSFQKWLASTPKNSAVFPGGDGHSYSFYSIAIDKGGNREADKPVGEANTTVDASPPSSKVSTMPAFQRKASFKVSWTGSDATSGVKRFDVYSAMEDGDYEKWQAATTATSAEFLGEDGHAYEFYSIATDNAGNEQPGPSESDIARVKVDLAAPVVTASVGDPNLGSGPVMISPQTPITLESEDGFSGMNATYYVIDGRPAKAYSAAFRESSAGSHNMTYWGVDRAGNKCENGTLWFFVDNAAPVTVAAYNGPMTAAGGKVFVSLQTTISLSALDDGSGIAKTEYKLDNAAYKAYTEPLKLATAGQHTIVYRSVDKLGNSEAENTLKLTVDNAPPTTKAGSYDPLSNEDITISLSATDTDSGVCATCFRILKEKATTGDFQNGTEVVIAAGAGGSADGNYTVQYYSVDMLGNKEAQKNLTVRIDTVVFLQLARETATVTKDRFTVEGKAEAGSKVSVNGESVSVSADGSFSADVPLKAGKNTITVQATDQAGNADSKTVTVTYNKPAEGTGMLLPIVAIVVVAACAGAGVLLWMRGKKKK